MRKILVSFIFSLIAISGFAQDYKTLEEGIEFFNNQVVGFIQLDKSGKVSQYNEMNNLWAEYNLKDIGVVAYGGMSPQLEGDTTEHHWIVVACKNGKCINKKKNLFSKKFEMTNKVTFFMTTKKEADNAVKSLTFLLKQISENNETVVKDETIIKNYVFEKKSDVDNNIPKTEKSNSLCFALIIGNEDYKSYQKELSTEANVEFARNDASAFKEYAINTLGVPERNITFLLDATTAQINQALSKINLLSKASAGNAELVFYFAGHGLPDETSKEPYLIPVDVSGKYLTTAIKLTDIYAKLTEQPHKKVTVFLDACFSGGARNQGLLEARSVRIKPKNTDAGGKLIVFSAVSGEQTALPYPEKFHGFFTYFLLKKLQESKGIVSYKEMSDYLTQTIGLESVLAINKEQTPQTNVSQSALKDWEKWKFISDLK